jgi:hypothetical protein
MFEELPVIPTVNDSIQFWKFFESLKIQAAIYLPFASA